MSEDKPSFENTTPKRESIESSTRLKNAVAAGLLIAVAVHGEAAANITTPDIIGNNQNFTETTSLKDDAMESLLEKSENGIEGDFTQVLLPEFRDLSFKSRLEYHFALQKRKDNKWYLVGLKKGDEKGVRNPGLARIKERAESDHVSESFLIHNHPVEPWFKIFEPRTIHLSMPDKDDQLIEKNLAISANGLSAQLEMIQKGIIPPLPSPPSIDDLLTEKANQSYYLDSQSKAVPPKGIATEARGIWEYSCSPEDPKLLTEIAEDGFKYRNFNSNPLTPAENEYQKIQFVMRLPYSDEAISSYRLGEKSKLDNENQLKTTLIPRLKTSAEAIGCHIEFTSYDDIENNKSKP